MADDYAEHSAANPPPDDLDYAEHSAANPPPDDLNSPARQALRDSLVETITRLPVPAAGRYVLEEGKGILRPALRWQYAEGTERQNQLVPPEYLLMMGDQEYATWLPQGWTLNVFPIGLTLPHLECWLNWGETTVAVEEQGDISPSTDRSSLALATPRRLVTHAYLLVHHLGLSDPPSEPRQPMDLAGCLAELRRVRDFLRREPSAEGAVGTALPPLLASFLSASELATMLGLKNDAVEVELRRYRQKYPDCAVDTMADGRRRNEPRYLYRVVDVLSHLKERFGLSDD
jgi:hypothetical protein